MSQGEKMAEITSVYFISYLISDFFHPHLNYGGLEIISSLGKANKVHFSSQKTNKKQLNN